MNDQSVKADAGKIQPTLVPREIIRAIATIRAYGNAKYPEGGKDNWKNVEPERYRDALCRHLMAYLDDPHGVDEESGYPHLWHLATNVAFLCELEKPKPFNENKYMWECIDSIADFIYHECEYGETWMYDKKGKRVMTTDIGRFLEGLCDLKDYFERKCKA